MVTTKTTSDGEKAEVLNQFFEGVFTLEDDRAFLDPPQYTFSKEHTVRSQMRKCGNFEVLCKQTR